MAPAAGKGGQALLSWQELKNSPPIIGLIDWEMTPAQAFEAYQIKSIDAWKHRGLEDVYYFYVSTWQGRGQVILVRRTMVDSQEIAVAPAPETLVAACLAAGDGQQYPRGQLPLDEPLRQWLRAELGL